MSHEIKTIEIEHSQSNTLKCWQKSKINSFRVAELTYPHFQ